jgi:hypothetical protein
LKCTISGPNYKRSAKFGRQRTLQQCRGLQG